MLLIDQPAWRWRGRLWSHLISDTSMEELHNFARAVGLRYASFGLDHYDVPEELFDLMLGAGAVEADSREIVRRLRAAGLREQRGKHLRSWTRGSLIDASVREEVDATAQLLAARVPDDIYILERPNTQLVMFEVEQSARLTASSELLESTRETAPTATPVVTFEPSGLVVVELVYGRF